MSSFPALSALRAACFPGNTGGSDNTSLLQSISDLVTRRVMTRPRLNAVSTRHPQNQAGMILEEDGNTVLRAGHALYDHSVGATLVLRPDDTIVLTAPGGLLLSGPVFTSDTPTEALNMGGFRLDPVWETTPIVVAISPLLLNAMFVAPAPGAPAVIPLSTLFKSLPLYQAQEAIPDGD